MAAAAKEDKTLDIPDCLIDSSEGRTYKRKRFYGKGGFGHCYEIIDVETEDLFACKIVSKKLMIKHSQSEKIAQAKVAQEISIHRGLNHPNIVKFHSSFEDVAYTYIVLELCPRRSMMELQKRRKTITEFECRYYIFQIIQGVKYLHDNRIIHRDLKLGNLFLNDLLHVKIGDFGLAARIDFKGERRMSMCGSPNYISPEVLTKKGHSFEVDIWSIGCVMYTLLVGRTPFDTKTLSGTYAKIRNCEYHLPSNLRKPAKDMLVSMLQQDPENRPAADELLNFAFLKASKVPKFLPRYCLTKPPRFGHSDAIQDSIRSKSLKAMSGIKTGTRNDGITASSKAEVCRHNEDYRNDIENLHQQLQPLINKKPRIMQENLADENIVTKKLEKG